MFLMLTCTASHTLHKVMAVTVHNKYSDIELVSPVYFCSGGTYYEYPIEETNKGVIMKLDFRFDPNQDESGGILMYEIRRKGNIRFDHRSDIDTMYVKAIEYASKMMRLLVTWKMKHLEEPKVNVILIEYDNELVLNEDKLAQLYENVNVISCDSYTWSMYSNMALKTKCEAVWRTGLELKIEISKGFRYEDNIRPMWIDAERQVQLKMVIYFY
jgi:hypothetical protein